MAKKICKGDKVKVLVGRSKGMVANVQRTLADGRLIVEGVNMVKKHRKPNPQRQISGGIIDQESPIHASNVAIWNENKECVDYVRFKVENGKKVRVFKRSGELIDEVSEN